MKCNEYAFDLSGNERQFFHSCLFCVMVQRLLGGLLCRRFGSGSVYWSSDFDVGFCADVLAPDRRLPHDENAGRNGRRAPVAPSRRVSLKMSGRATKRHARKMIATCHELNVDLKRNARLAFDERLWSGTRRTARPTGTWLEARRSTGGPAFEVDFVRGGALQGHMWTILVVPGTKEMEFALQ
jgi:hypothetical protein